MRTKPHLRLVKTERSKSGDVSSMKSYPEHEKLKAVKDQTQMIGEFLTWLQTDRAISLTSHILNQYGVTEKQYHNVESLLAEYFEIDLKKLELEKREMLYGLRNSV